MSDQHIGAFTRLVRQDPLAAAHALRAALSDEAYTALFEALTSIEGWQVDSIRTETDDAGAYDPPRMRYQRKTVTYDRWVDMSESPPQVRS